MMNGAAEKYSGKSCIRTDTIFAHFLTEALRDGDTLQTNLNIFPHSPQIFRLMIYARDFVSLSIFVEIEAKCND